jgi:hypothetical protein
MKLRKMQTIHVYEGDDGVRYRHIVLNGTETKTRRACFAWQRIKVTDFGSPYWSGDISARIIDQLEDAIKLESFEHGP